MDRSHTDVARVVHALFLGIYQLADRHADLSAIRGHEAAIIEILRQAERARCGRRLRVVVDNTLDGC